MAPMGEWAFPTPLAAMNGLAQLREAAGADAMPV